jgi:hypothetical protein
MDTITSTGPGLFTRVLFDAILGEEGGDATGQVKWWLRWLRLRSSSKG